MTHPRRQPAVPLLEPQPTELDPSARSLPWTLRWRMIDELRFLRGLGSWRKRESVPDRAQLLQGYLEGLARRRRWTDLQLEPLECEARLLLEETRRGGGRAA